MMDLMGMNLTIEEEAYALYLEATYPVVMILDTHIMYGVDSMEDGTQLMLAERD